MCRIINRIIFLAMIPAALSFAQPAKLNIAVQELAGKGIDQSAAGIISDVLSGVFGIGFILSVPF